MTRARLNLATAALTLALAVALAAAGHFALGLALVALFWFAAALFQAARGGERVPGSSSRLWRRVSRILLFWT
jgi:hypothetical protein